MSDDTQGVATEEPEEKLFRQPIWFTDAQLDWLDDQVRIARSEERRSGDERTQISRSTIIRRWIDTEIGAAA